MAEASGKLTGRPGVCFVTRGPGATNASTGVHTAFQFDTDDFVCRTGSARHAGSGGISRGRFPRNVRTPCEMGSGDQRSQADSGYVHRAFQTALAGRPGPWCFLCQKMFYPKL